MNWIRKILSYVLMPFAWLYGRITGMRNWLYDKELIPSKRFDLPIIGIGNLSAGGTGKTPMAEYILQLLQDNGYRPALLSRGYKRRTKGFHLVKPFTLAIDVGDEPYQIKQKFPDVLVAVCEDRVEGISRIRQNYPDVDVVVLDDCLQHRSLKPGFNILLTDFSRPYFEDHLLPAGMLREPTSGRARADIIVVTKCPDDLPEKVKEAIKEKLKPYPGQEVYFSHIHYHELRRANHSPEEEVYPIDFLKGYNILLFAGIANPLPLESHLRSIASGLMFMRFPDHHRYTIDDIKKIEAGFQKISSYNKLLVTTEKDWRRLEGAEEGGLLTKMPVYFLPISVKWNKEEKLSFDEKILVYVRKNSGNS